MDWRGLAAVILATGVSVAVIVTLAGAVLSSHVITEQESALISGVIGAAVGAVATYLGGGGRLELPSGPGRDDQRQQAGGQRHTSPGDQVEVVTRVSDKHDEGEHGGGDDGAQGD